MCNKIELIQAQQTALCSRVPKGAVGALYMLTCLASHKVVSKMNDPWNPRTHLCKCWWSMFCEELCWLVAHLLQYTRSPKSTAQPCPACPACTCPDKKSQWNYGFTMVYPHCWNFCDFSPVVAMTAPNLSSLAVFHDWTYMSHDVSTFFHVHISPDVEQAPKEGTINRKFICFATSTANECSIVIHPFK